MPHGPCQYVLAQDETTTEEKAPIEKKKHSIKKRKKHTHIISTNSTVDWYQLSGIWEMDEYF